VQDDEKSYSKRGIPLWVVFFVFLDKTVVFFFFLGNIVVGASIPSSLVCGQGFEFFFFLKKRVRTHREGEGEFMGEWVCRFYIV